MLHACRIQADVVAAPISPSRLRTPLHLLEHLASRRRTHKDIASLIAHKPC